MFLYLAFFTVQIFFNLDIAQRAANHPNTFIEQSANRHAENIKKATEQSFPNHKIRLNKRFQPSNIPAILHDLVTVHVIYDRLKPVALPQGNLYSSVFLSTHTLRGPPVIA